MARHLMALVDAALAHRAVLVARLDVHAQVEEGRLGAVARQDVEVLRGVLEARAVVEREHHKIAAYIEKMLLIAKAC